MLVPATQLHRHEKIAPDCGAHRPQDLQQDSGTRLEVAVVLVGPVVDGARQELMQKVAVARDDLDAIRARLTRAPRGVGIVLHQSLDLGDGHPPTTQAVEQVGFVGGAHRQHVDEFLPRKVALPAGEVQLNDVTAIVFMYFRDQRPPRGNRPVVIDARVTRHGDPVGPDARIGRNNCGDTAPREPPIPGDPRVGHRAVVVIDPSTQAGADHPVLQRQPVDGQRLKDRIAHWRCHHPVEYTGDPSLGDRRLRRYVPGA